MIGLEMSNNNRMIGEMSSTNKGGAVGFVKQGGSAVYYLGRFIRFRPWTEFETGA